MRLGSRISSKHAPIRCFAQAVKRYRWVDARGIAQLMRLGWFRPEHSNVDFSGIRIVSLAG